VQFVIAAVAQPTSYCLSIELRVPYLFPGNFLANQSVALSKADAEASS
jgi:hypothetical protein